MAIFSFMVAFASYNIVSGILWARYKPIQALVRACLVAATIVTIFKTGESIPPYYAKYLLGYF